MTEPATARKARTALLDNTATTSVIDAALNNLDAALAGWPTSTPGAPPAEPGPLPDGVCDEQIPVGHVIAGPNTGKGAFTPCEHPLPCPDHPTTAMSITERAAFTDKARRDLERLEGHIGKLAHHARAAAAIAIAWGTPQLDKTSITRRIQEIDAGIWCQNCVRHGYRNPRIEGEQRCSFCGDFRRYWLRDDNGQGIEAPKDILDLRAAKSRLYETDITRILARLGLAWKHPKKKKVA